MSSSNQFLVSMKFMGIDALSPTMQKMTQQVKQMKSQVDKLGSGPSGGFKFIDQMNAGLKASVKILDDLQGKFDKMKSSGFGNIMTGTAMVAPILKALDDAGQMQTKMITIGGATGSSPQDLKAMQGIIREASNVTKFSSLQVADMAVKLATSGMTADQVKSLTPIMAKFAEVQQYGKGSAPEEAITQAVSSAHMLGIYDPKQLDAYLNKFNKATFMTPGNTSEFFDTFKYLAPTAKGMGMSNDDTLYTAALANRVGLLGSMGGTESADMILRSIPGIFGGNGHVDKKGNFKPSKQLGAMMDLGLAKADGSSVFFNNKGEFQGIENFIKKLSDASKGVNPEQLMKDFKNMFGMQGERLAVILSERGGEQLQLIEQQMANMSTLTDFQKKYNESYKGQMDQFKTNLSNLSTDVGNALAPTATKMLNAAQPYITNASKWIQTHQDEVEKIAKVTAELGGFLLVLGAGKIAIGTIGSLVISPLKLAATSLATAFGTLKTKTIAKDLAPQAIQANIVNVFGGVVNGGGGGVPILEPGGGKPTPTILGPNGKPISSAPVLSEAAKEMETVVKSGAFANVTKSIGNGLWTATKGFKSSLLFSAPFAAMDIMNAPEGHKIEAASKDTGSVMGGFAAAGFGAELGAGIGTMVFPGPGTVVGGILGAVIASAAGSVIGEKLGGYIYGLFNNTKPPELPHVNNGWSDTAKYVDMQNSAQTKNQSYTDNSTYNLNVTSTDPKASADALQAILSGNLTKRSSLNFGGN
ncbi:MAG: phage tail tape measure protein family [Bacilli bacterium]|nr:phage tail tape measure protein family [Bacilli bacterium]